MKRTNIILSAALFAALSFAQASAQPESLTIAMHALNGSGEDGMATLTQVADGVRVVVDLQHAPSDVQPTHIHLGTCGNINKAPEYGLQLTAQGHSESVVRGVTLDDLKKQAYAINVHKSASDLATYVSCGNIR